MRALTRIVLRRDSGDIIAEVGNTSLGFHVDEIEVRRMEDRLYAVAIDRKNFMEWFIPLNDNVELLYEDEDARNKQNKAKKK